jgi:hypothetical protein
MREPTQEEVKKINDAIAIINRTNLFVVRGVTPWEVKQFMKEKSTRMPLLVKCKEGL